MPTVRASPKNERFWGVQRSGHGAIYRRKSGAVERQNLQVGLKGHLAPPGHQAADVQTPVGV